MQQLIKPPFPYVGAKTRLVEKILPLLPAHTHYIEPFAGSLAVLLAKPKSVAETANDIDGDLMHFWATLRDHTEELIRAIALTPHSRAEYYASRATLHTGDTIEDARRTFVRLTQSATRTLEPGMWARYVRYAPGGTSIPAQLQMYEERLWAVAERLRHVSLDQRDGVAAIRMYGREPSNLLYIDPPYIRKDRYRYSVDHEVLLKAVSEARAHIVISGYASQLYDTYLKDWERHVFPTFAGGRGTKIVPREEIVWVKC